MARLDAENEMTAPEVENVDDVSVTKGAVDVLPNPNPVPATAVHDELVEVIVTCVAVLSRSRQLPPEMIVEEKRN